MSAFHILILLMAVMYHVSAKTPIHNFTLTYECTNDDKIIIKGNDTNLRGSILAMGTGINGSNVMCRLDRNVTRSGVTFTVSSCNVSQPVNIIVTQESQNISGDMALGGRIVNMYVMQCSHVGHSGLDINTAINNTENNELKINITHQKEVNMTMKITDKGGKELGSNATVKTGEELQLIIEGNGGFSFLARSCMATDGTTNRAHSKSLILNGTTQDAAVISSLSNNRNQNHTELKASLVAFHFMNTNNVSIICTITVCQGDDNSCPFQILPHTYSLETSFRVMESYTMRVEKTD